MNQFSFTKKELKEFQQDINTGIKVTGSEELDYFKLPECESSEIKEARSIDFDLLPLLPTRYELALKI